MIYMPVRHPMGPTYTTSSLTSLLRNQVAIRCSRLCMAAGATAGSWLGSVLTEVEGTQQDVEAQQIDEQIPHIVRQPQVIGLLDERHGISTMIRRSNLIGGHAREQRIGPARTLTRFLQILFTFLAGTDTSRDVPLVQYAVLHVGGIEIGKCQNGEKHDGRHIQQPLFQEFHTCKF